jgi:L-fuconolactonase
MIEILDSHTHFWNPALLGYPWLENVPAINRVMLPSELPVQGNGWRIEKFVFVQADALPEQGYAEAAWVSGLKDERLAAIVAFAPLELGARAREALELLRALPRVKGVRRLLQDEAPGFALQPAFMDAVRLLAAFDYSFDICIRHHQLREARMLINACPDVRFVLDHMGKPNIRGHEFDDWRDDLQKLAAYPNVMCKLSGVITEAGAGWQLNDLLPYLDHALTCFGAERVMFGSDSPVLLLDSSIEVWIETMLRFAAPLSPGEHKLLFYENARRFYTIE